MRNFRTARPPAPRTRPRALTALLGVLAACIGGSAVSEASEVAAAPAPNAYAVVGVNLVAMTGGPVALPNRTVLIDDGRIAAIGGPELALPGGVRRIDGTGRWLLPGFVDMHVHLAQGTGSIDDGFGRQMRLLLATGVTTARALIAPPNGLEMKARVESGAVPGPRLVVYGGSINGNSVSGPADVETKVAEYRAAGYDGVKTHGGLDAATYDALVAAAAAARLPLSGHVTPGYGLDRALAAGQQVEHLDGYLAALFRSDAPMPPPPGQILIDPEVLAQIDEAKMPALVADTKARGVVNGPTLALFRTLAGGESLDQLRARPELRYAPRPAVDQWTTQATQTGLKQAPLADRNRYLALRDRLVRELHAAGAPLLVSSDSPQFFMVPGFAFHRELEALVTAGLSPYAALEAATVNAARYFGRLDRSGTIEVGKDADLVLLAANPLENIANAKAVAGVSCRGRWFTDTEIQAMLSEVEASAARVP
jgi:imidazolonepropionase-like amidohydrolase